MAPDRCNTCRSRWCPGATGGPCIGEDSVGLYPKKLAYNEEWAKQAREAIKTRDVDVEQTGKACRIPGCAGAIVRKYARRYDATSGPVIIGPGSKDQYYKALAATYCETCKVMYAHDV